jgi:hypothetical protein
MCVLSRARSNEGKRDFAFAHSANYFVLQRKIKFFLIDIFFKTHSCQIQWLIVSSSDNI